MGNRTPLLGMYYIFIKIVLHSILQKFVFEYRGVKNNVNKNNNIRR